MFYSFSSPPFSQLNFINAYKVCVERYLNIGSPTYSSRESYSFSIFIVIIFLTFMNS